MALPIEVLGRLAERIKEGTATKPRLTRDDGHLVVDAYTIGLIDAFVFENKVTIKQLIDVFGGERNLQDVLDVCIEDAFDTPEYRKDRDGE